MRHWADVVSVGAIGAVAIVMTAILRRVDWKHTYHSGFDPYVAAALCAIAAAFGVTRVVTPRRRRWIAAALVFLSVASGAAILWLDHHNFIVSYERWLKRGMPEHPF
jgi:hypothetical protein